MWLEFPKAESHSPAVRDFYVFRNSRHIPRACMDDVILHGELFGFHNFRSIHNSLLNILQIERPVCEI
jgi:hypothetical protein